jgi:hypothetical protein
MQELVAKIYLFLARKIIYSDPEEMENIFIKRFTSQLCAIFGTGASHDKANNISKN